MKNILRIFAAGIAVIALNGCGEGDNYYHDDPPIYIDPVPELVTLYLVDDFGDAIEYVPYVCRDGYDEIITEGNTLYDGEFTFALGDRCTFDLFGFPNSYQDNMFIVDDIGFGKDDIPYYCENEFGGFTEGVTDFDGFFAYPVDALCKFYF